jgi:outer membrane protein OmpA-like peptidoglycan-associated protein
MAIPTRPAPNNIISACLNSASSVLAYLTAQGLDAAQLKAKGLGKSKPRAANPFSAENRRAETYLLEQ